MLDGATGTIKMVEIKPKPIKPKCVRNLFGSPSEKEKEQIKQLYSDCLKEDAIIAKEKYEYDIVSDVPLSDRWEITTTAPEFYSRVYGSKSERLISLKRKHEGEHENEETEAEASETHRPRNLRQPPLTSKY